MIKILIVDDSPTESALLKYLFESEKDMKVVGIARNGKEALKLIPILKPDVITMDIQMPELNGFEATKLIMSQHPTPIVVISSAVNDPMLNTTFEALQAGAVSVLNKPQNVNVQFNQENKYIIEIVRSMSEIKVIRRRFHVSPKATSPKKITTPDVPISNAFEIIAIGTSVGGPQALRTILEKLPSDFPVPIVVVQHMTNGFIHGFTKWLNNHTQITIKEAINHEMLIPGSVYFAPDHCHLGVRRFQGKLRADLVKKEPVAGFCPSATVLLQSVAKVCNKNAIGILLTGMGNDGAEGLLELKNAGGHTLIQDQASTVVFGMAGTAQSMGAVDKVIELEQMADYLMKMTRPRS